MKNCLPVAVVGVELAELVADNLHRMVEEVDSRWERRRLKAEHMCFGLVRKNLEVQEQT